ncbi:phosphotransferase [uncultured Paraglaciecola sp.]|uniref:aminoglycoside phosphotransferase family protein n=1 Tax=uncultured Paraglaciecola sp. TaxID=1765024 RepID=UPI0026062A66|nr:phosphotransferase [uncultured Paraglaciecola sp.]
MKKQLSSKQLRQQQLRTWINQSTDYDCDVLEIVAGDAGFRRYFRFASNNQTFIAVDAPIEFEDASKFIAVAQSYREKGVKVPQVYAYDFAQGFYIQQDFGNHMFSDVLSVDCCDQLYPKALANIPIIQSCVLTQSGPLPDFDAEFIDRELSIFPEWLLDKYLQLSLTPSEKSMLSQAFESIKNACLSQPKAGMHRDYHSRNLMLLENDEIGVIDFQDAVVGPITYDAVSLLRDSYQDWPQPKVLQWLKNWHGEYYSQYSWAEFKKWFDCVGIQRHTKIAGIFARLYLRDDKSSYLFDIPHTLNYLIAETVQYPEYGDFSYFVQERVLPSVLQKLQVSKHET